MPEQKRNKLATSVRLSADARRLLKGLAAKLGVSQAAVLELMVREWAKREGVE